MVVQTQSVIKTNEKEEEEVVTEKPTLSSVAAISYLDELGEFVLFQQSPELLDLINKSRITIEKLMCRLKQTTLSDCYS